MNDGTNRQSAPDEEPLFSDDHFDTTLFSNKESSFLEQEELFDEPHNELEYIELPLCDETLEEALLEPQVFTAVVNQLDDTADGPTDSPFDDFLLNFYEPETTITQFAGQDDEGIEEPEPCFFAPLVNENNEILNEDDMTLGLEE